MFHRLLNMDIFHPRHPASPASTPQSFEMATPTQPTLNKPRHVKYWLRCLKTCLPTDYTSVDLSRTSLAFFSVSALDLLGELATSTTSQDREGWIEWCYSLQLPTGGFRASPATDLKYARTETNARWDPPTLPGSYFCLAILTTLGDDLSRVKKKELLEWLPSVQRDNGSFGEWVTDTREIVGSDHRFGLFAAAVRWMLRGEGGRLYGDVKDIDWEGTVRFIASSESYDHGIGEGPLGEAHAGHTYCALGALSLFGVLHPNGGGISSHQNVARWLVARQTPLPNGETYDEYDLEDIMESNDEDKKAKALRVEVGSDGKPLWGGFNGRTNKKQDTCYSFWVGGSLDMLKRLHLIDVNANRRFLLEKTQHIIGGFMKIPQPGCPPDIIHAFTGLAALALMREEGVNRLDPALGISMQAKERLMGLDWWKGSS